MVLEVEEADGVPERAGALRHGVGLARVPPAILLEEAPRNRARERPGRILAGAKVSELGQLERELGLVDRDGLVMADPVSVAPPWIGERLGQLDGEIDGDGLTPVALPREDPVAQPVRHRRRAAPQLLQRLDDRALALKSCQPVELAAVEVDAVVPVG